jgi:hypothetical protein
MIETPAEYMESATGAARYGGEGLARFSYHTGAPPRRLAPDEPCPILFRDLGSRATRLFLRGELARLAGPFSPIVYTRTHEYSEPYVDYEGIGRLVFLRPLVLAPWDSGVAAVYVARADRVPPREMVGFVPGGVELARVSAEATYMRTRDELREAFGGAAYDVAVAETFERVERVEREIAETEPIAEPLRRALQSGDRDTRRRASDELERLGITENDLCAAWHHLPRARRELVREALANRSVAAYVEGAR